MVGRPSLPDKCQYEMALSEFRAWKRSMWDYVEIYGMKQKVALASIRLNCETKLMRALDARHTRDDWNSLTVNKAFDEIQEITTKTMNKAVMWDRFFGRMQQRGESVKEYIDACNQAAVDCDFTCPHCMGDVSEYMIRFKVMMGIANPALKHEILRDSEIYDTTKKIILKCESYEETEKDIRRRGPVFDGASAVVEGDTCPPTPGQMEEAAAVRTAYKKQKEEVKQKIKCGFCGYMHSRGRPNCPAGNAQCFVCNKIGHFAVCCRNRGNSERASGSATHGQDPTVGQVTVLDVGAASCTQPVLLVKVTNLHNKVSGSFESVADTGAEVCIAGIVQADALGIDIGQLEKPVVQLQHAAGGRMEVLGRCRVAIQHGIRVANEDIYFVMGTHRLFLSLKTCKSLGLVHEGFPNHLLDINSCASVGEEVQRQKPSALPFPPLEENVPQLGQWLLERFSGSTFKVDKRPFPVMNGEPHHIHLIGNATPYACHTPIPIPKHWEKEVKKQIDEDVRAGILRPVPTGEVTEWCSRMVVVGKKDGTPRRTVDFQKLNAQCKRETHHTLAPFDMVSSIPCHRFKSTVDAHWGFHQVELDNESRKLTTFITPWGRYQYCRTPMGHCAAPDAYTKRFDDIISDVGRKFKCIDDVLLYDSSVEEAFWHMYDFLELCENNGITLNPKKFQFCQREVDFVGYTLLWDKFLPSEDKLSAIKNFPMPESPSISDIRSWFGLVNQLAPFVATAPIMAPFRDLLKKGNGRKVYWDDNLKMRFEYAKTELCKLVVNGLVYYDMSRPTAIITDWSKDGMGFVVVQQYCDCISPETPFCCAGGWKLVLCGSRQLSTEEGNYAPIEGEAAAVVWGLKKSRLFLLGCPNFTLVTDHRPLVKLFGDRELKGIENPRLFRLKEKTLQFRFSVKYISGKKNIAADALSRYPSVCNSIDDTDLAEAEEIEAQAAACVIASAYVIDDDVIVVDSSDVEKAAANDSDYQLLLQCVREDAWPVSRNKVRPELKPFFQVRERLGTIGNTVTYAFDEGHIRLVVPGNLRDRVARCLHSGHQGIDSMLRRARQAVYWPGMEADLKLQRARCDTCNIHAPSQQREPLLGTDPPDFPFQKTAADFFQIGNKFYLAYADRLTGWLEISYFPNGVTSSRVIPVLRRMFCRWGTPEEISTDGGTNLASSEVLDFYRRWGVKLRLSSVHYPQSNGRAEAAVRSAKRMIRDNVRGDGSLDTDELARALMQHRNTPLRETDKSPAQLVLGRQLRDSIPMYKDFYKPDNHWGATLREREKDMIKVRDREKEAYDIHAKQLPRLRVGTEVALQDPISRAWDKSGTIMEQYPYRQYLVKVDGSGRVTRRNRRHLKYLPPSSPQYHPATQPEPAPPPASQRISTRTARKPSWMHDYVT